MQIAAESRSSDILSHNMVSHLLACTRASDISGALLHVYTKTSSGLESNVHVCQQMRYDKSNPCDCWRLLCGVKARQKTYQASGKTFAHISVMSIVRLRLRLVASVCSAVWFSVFQGRLLMSNWNECIKHTIIANIFANVIYGRNIGERRPHDRIEG